MGRLATILLLLALPLHSMDYYSLPDDELVTLAEEGNVEAIYNLGLILEELDIRGNSLRFNSIEKDPYHWLQKAAELDHPQAITKMGIEHLTSYGYFNKKDFKKAYNLFLKSADRDQEASLLLSILLYHGMGVEKNIEQSLNYFSKSQSDFYRINGFIYLEDNLVKMIQELVKQDNPDAHFVLGDFYYYGRSKYYDQDYKKAYRVYSKGAELGSVSASYMAGMMSYNGEGTLKDFNSSFKFIEKSADGGNVQGKVKLGIMSYFGEGSPVDFDKAYKNFSFAAEKDNSLAQYFLGVMYYKGEGTEQNSYQSKFWIKKAYENGSPSAGKFWNAKELWKIPEPVEEPTTDDMTTDDVTTDDVTTDDVTTDDMTTDDMTTDDMTTDDMTTDDMTTDDMTTDDMTTDDVTTDEAVTK